MMEIPELKQYLAKKQLNLLPFSLSHDTKSTVKLKITNCSSYLHRPMQILGGKLEYSQ